MWRHGPGKYVDHHEDTMPQAHRRRVRETGLGAGGCIEGKGGTGGMPPDKTVEPHPPSKTPVAPVEPKKKGVMSEVVNGPGGGQQIAAVLTEELAAIWKRMCSPRGVANEFDAAQGVDRSPRRVNQAWPSTTRSFAKHAVSHPRQFRSMQPARLCAKDVYCPAGTTAGERAGEPS